MRETSARAVPRSGLSRSFRWNAIGEPAARSTCNAGVARSVAPALQYPGAIGAFRGFHHIFFSVAECSHALFIVQSLEFTFGLRGPASFELRQRLDQYRGRRGRASAWHRRGTRRNGTARRHGPEWHGPGGRSAGGHARRHGATGGHGPQWRRSAERRSFSRHARGQEGLHGQWMFALSRTE